MCGIDASVREAVLDGPHRGGQHLAAALKFVAIAPPDTASGRSNAVPGHLMALGGAWDAELDGGDPGM